MNEDLEQYFPLVEQIVSRVQKRIGNAVSRDELVAEGRLGLVEASKSFDFSRGIPFGTHASFRIKGAILDSLRKRDLLSREERKVYNFIRKTQHELSGKLGRDPTESELATEMNWSLSKLRQKLSQLEGRDIISLESTLDEGRRLELPDTRVPNPEELLILKDTQVERDKVRSIVSELSIDLQEIYRYYYIDGLKLTKIAELHGVSESRICQKKATLEACIRQGLGVSKKRNTKMPGNLRIITVNGESLTIKQWADKLGCNPQTIHSRLHQGWSEEDAVTRPPGKLAKRTKSLAPITPKLKPTVMSSHSSLEVSVTRTPANVQAIRDQCRRLDDIENKIQEMLKERERIMSNLANLRSR